MIANPPNAHVKVRRMNRVHRFLSALAVLVSSLGAEREREAALVQLTLAENLVNEPDGPMTRRAMSYALARVRAYVETGVVDCPHLVAGKDGRCSNCSTAVTPRAMRASCL